MDALLVGYERQENLGLRSIAACLLEQGYEVAIVPFSPRLHPQIVATAVARQPRLIGFSLIFQYALEDFGRLMTALREAGVSAHFTAGGHFPSLRPRETLTLLPHLDSVVRSEGEHTLLELLARLDQPDGWPQIQGLAFRRGSDCVVTAPRALIGDLDTLPYVYRDEQESPDAGIHTAAMLASRGCLFDCSFCSIRQFYGQTPGRLRRVRSPSSVVDEMSLLASTQGVRFFNFQDDDFAARTPGQRRWLGEFLAALERAGLADHICWKISCRVDDLEPATLEMMVEHGLIAVYLGVESGSRAGLQVLNKRVTVEQNLNAVQLVKDAGIALAMGFMLFDPSSTLQTIRENLDFLRAVGEDGYFPLNFCKMLPYAGTRIEAELRRAGRLEGTIVSPDYRFLDERTDWYAFVVQRVFTRRNFAEDGLVAGLQAAESAHRMRSRFAPLETAVDDGAALRRLNAQSNGLALTTLEELLEVVEGHDVTELLRDEGLLPPLAEREWRGEMQIELQLEQMNRSRCYV